MGWIGGSLRKLVVPAAITLALLGLISYSKKRKRRNEVKSSGNEFEFDKSQGKLVCTENVKSFVAGTTPKQIQLAPKHKTKSSSESNDATVLNIEVSSSEPNETDDISKESRNDSNTNQNNSTYPEFSASKLDSSKDNVNYLDSQFPNSSTLSSSKISTSHVDDINKNYINAKKSSVLPSEANLDMPGAIVTEYDNSSQATERTQMNNNLGLEDDSGLWSPEKKLGTLDGECGDNAVSLESHSVEEKLPSAGHMAVDRDLAESTPAPSYDIISQYSGGQSPSEAESLNGSGEVKANNSIKTMMGEMSAKTTFKRSAKGPVQISLCAPDGSYLQLHNTGSKTEDVGGWSIVRSFDSGQRVTCELQSDLVLQPGADVRIYAVGKRPINSTMDFECELATWGTGINIETKLLNTAGKDRAILTQTTSYVMTS